MNQIPNIEEEESPLYALKNRIKWDYSYYISREESANGYWKRVDSIDQVPLHAARTHRTHPVEEPDNLFLYKIYQYLLAHHQQLQKARGEAEKAVWERIKKTAQRDETGMYMFYLPDHSELDQLTRDDWNEDMERSHTLAELDQDKGNVSQSDLYGHSTTANATGVNNCTGAELDQDKK